MKRKIAIGMSILSLAAGMSAFTGCGGKDEAPTGRVMNVALNPEVEFVLDADDKVLTVNALNEEGNLVISAAAFADVEGKTAEEAASLFVQVSKENGFLFEGSIGAGENEIKISFSGEAEEVKQLYEDVKTTIVSYLETSGITATVAQAAAITEERLRALVEECAPYFEAAEVQAMEYAELVTTLVESRKETAEFYSQELKNAYYEAKAFAMEKAELQTLKSHMNTLAQVAFDIAFKVYEGAVSGIETLRKTTLVNENSVYQIALQAFREAKTEYLNFRNYVAELEESALTAQISQQLATLQTALDQAEEQLLNAGVSANRALDDAKAQVKTAYDKVVEKIQEASLKVSDYLNEVSTAQVAAQEQFFTSFETEYAAAKTAAKERWEAMSDALKGNTAEN